MSATIQIFECGREYKNGYGSQCIGIFACLESNVKHLETRSTGINLQFVKNIIVITSMKKQRLVAEGNGKISKTKTSQRLSQDSSAEERIKFTKANYINTKRNNNLKKKRKKKFFFFNVLLYFTF